MKRTLLTILLCLATATALADGPLFSIWHIDGHGYAWQQAQIDAGLPIEPSVRMPHSVLRNEPQQVANLNADAPLLSRLDGRSIVLRMNNIGQEIDKTIPRVVLTEDNWRTSHMCVYRLSDGALEDTPAVSPWAGTSAWSEAGRLWATSLWMLRLHEIIPNPSGIILRENNEAGRVAFNQLRQSDRPRRIHSNGALVFAELTTPPEQYVDGNREPLTPDWYVWTGTDNKLYMERWRSDEELDAIDLRAKEWVEPRRCVRPSESLADYEALEREQYQALYAAFDANSAPGWQGKLRTVGYGGWEENHQNDAASPAMYLGNYRSADLTYPGAYAVNRWDAGTEESANEAINQKSWREYSISIGNPSAASVYFGFAAGRHAIVDPESFAGLMIQVIWRMHAPGREVRLSYWDNYNVKPSHLIFSTGANKTTLKQVYVDALTAIGRQDLLTLTIEDYELATLRQLARIHHHPVLNRYWREGTTVPLSSPLNTATATKVYATETRIPGESRSLLCVYTPCDLEGGIPVGEWSVPAGRLRYWLTPVELEEVE